MTIKNVQKEKLAVDRCMKHLEVVNVEPKVRQLISMYLTSIYREGYQDGIADGEKMDILNRKKDL
ncbi:hypothetical protein IQ283_10755 [Alkalihalobacillus hwajinpoensis]|uniref:hypothetical protein n=1 Tax=Guptibacillus hwajinpoensis TaxID=208199 RepID=UPI001883989E|nr:hypothetical protein [Pseudalkalibacillus hwajinpoensis]MBF0707072.1 hypothetical protein [Pseudalkalibacillus hwajinpoensis]